MYFYLIKPGNVSSPSNRWMLFEMFLTFKLFFTPYSLKNLKLFSCQLIDRSCKAITMNKKTNDDITLKFKTLKKFLKLRTSIFSLQKRISSKIHYKRKKVWSNKKRISKWIYQLNQNKTKNKIILEMPPASLEHVQAVFQ